MFLYTILAAIAGVVFCLVMAIRTKKAEGIVYGALDRVGRVTNIVLSAVYVTLAPFYMFLGMICSPNHDGFLGFVGWIVSIISASAALFCGLGIGASVALRRKGRGVLSFALQFAGVVGIALTVSFYAIFVGNLLSPLN